MTVSPTARHHVIESIDKLKGLENLYFDTGPAEPPPPPPPCDLLTAIVVAGAVTEAGATNALIRAFGPKKVMYGELRRTPQAQRWNVEMAAHQRGLIFKA